MNYLENISLLTWNIRGVNNKISRRILKNILTKERPKIIFIQEKKCEVFTMAYKESIWDESHKWITAEAQGLSGGASSVVGQRTPNVSGGKENSQLDSVKMDP